MRAARGNYMVMFALMLPVLLGLMAFAVDLGRLRVARIQAQNAADAAAVAALAALRDGGNYGDAEDAAVAAANAVRLQRIGDGSGANDFNVDLAFGEWNYADQAWRAAGSPSGVTVNVETNEPLGLLFAPIFGTKSYGGGNDGADARARDVRVGRRAAFRGRDVVFVIDTSRETTAALGDVRGAVLDAIDRMIAFEVPEDRVAFIEFAGDAKLNRGLTRLRGANASVRDEVSNVRPCRVGMDAWYQFYRFFAPSFDYELDGFQPFGYNAMALTEEVAAWSRSGLWLSWDFEDHSSYMFREVFFPADADIPRSESTWYRAQPESVICKAMFASYELFAQCDPRRVEDAGDCVPRASSTLDCHAGNYWEGRAGRYDTSVHLPEIDCTSFGLGEPYPGQEAYWDGGDGVVGVDSPDRAYVQAGTRHGAGLQLAANLLSAVQPSRNEPTVILVTGAAPKCGPLIDEADAPTCGDEVYDEAYDAVEDLEALGAVTHIVALLEDDVGAEAVLRTLTTGRGSFSVAESPDGLSELLDEVARDLKIQMVQ